MVWRRLRIAGNTSLASLHYIIQISQRWEDDHLHCFHIYGKDYGISKDGGMGFPDNPYQVTIDDFEFDQGDRFTYEYNFYENWLHDIRIEAIEESSPRKKTPHCLSGNGILGVIKSDYTLEMIDILRIIVNKDEQTTTVGEICRRIEALDEMRFNHKKVNKALSRLDLDNPTVDESFFMFG